MSRKNHRPGKGENHFQRFLITFLVPINEAEEIRSLRLISLFRRGSRRSLSFLAKLNAGQGRGGKAGKKSEMESDYYV